MTALVTKNLALLAEAPGGVTTLRALLLELAVTGRLSAAGPAWRATNLRELVVSSGAGWSPSCETRPRSGDEWGILKVSAVSWSQFRPDENKALPAHLAPRPELEVLTGDFLVSRANTAELVARSVVVEHTPPKLMLSDKIVRLRLSAACAPRFVQLANSAPAARSYYARVAGGTSSSMKNVSREQILALPVLLPPLAEQHRIVAKVDELMALCDRLEARQQDAEAAHAQLVQALLDSLTQARDADEFQACWQRLAGRFQDIFTTDESVDAFKQSVLLLGIEGRLVGHLGQAAVAGGLPSTTPFTTPAGWVWRRFGDTWHSSFYGPRFGKEDYVQVGGVPTIRTTDMTPEGRIDLRSPPRVELTSTQLQTYGLRSGDLLVTRSGSIGTMALFRLDLDAIPSAYLIRIRFLQSLLPEFGLFYLRSPMGQALLGLNTTSVGVPNVNATKMAEFPIAIPSVEEQHRIVAKVTELLALCDRLKARIAAARAKHAQLAEALVAQAVAA